MMKYEHYDVSFKIAAIEEYYRLKQDTKISIRSFARSKGICHATFYQWLRIYEDEKKEESGGDNQICLSSDEEKMTSSFIMISDSLPAVKDDCRISDVHKTMKLLCKDMIIEFNKEDLDYVLRSIRQ